VSSILTSTKKILGIDDAYTAFDVDLLMHINTVFATLNQLGIGPENGFSIEDSTTTWDTFLGSDLRLNSVKTYVCLRVRMLFDPPSSSYHVEAMNKQIQELEWRISIHREGESWTDPNLPG
jgi:hypothetical protein